MEVQAELERRGLDAGMLELLAERMAERNKANGGGGLNGGGDGVLN